MPLSCLLLNARKSLDKLLPRHHGIRLHEPRLGTPYRRLCRMAARINQRIATSFHLVHDSQLCSDPVLLTTNRALPVSDLRRRTQVVCPPIIVEQSQRPRQKIAGLYRRCHETVFAPRTSDLSNGRHAIWPQATGHGTCMYIWVLQYRSLFCTVTISIPDRRLGRDAPPLSSVQGRIFISVRSTIITDA